MDTQIKNIELSNISSVTVTDCKPKFTILVRRDNNNQILEYILVIKNAKDNFYNETFKNSSNFEKIQRALDFILLNSSLNINLTAQELFGHIKGLSDEKHVRFYLDSFDKSEIRNSYVNEYYKNDDSIPSTSRTTGHRLRKYEIRILVMI